MHLLLCGIHVLTSVLCSPFTGNAYCVNGTLLWRYSGSFISFSLISCLTLAKYEMLFLIREFSGTGKMHNVIGS